MSKQRERFTLDALIEWAQMAKAKRGGDAWVRFYWPNQQPLPECFIEAMSADHVFEQIRVWQWDYKWTHVRDRVPSDLLNDVLENLSAETRDQLCEDVDGLKWYVEANQ